MTDAAKLMELYQRLAKDMPRGFTDMSDEEKAAYMREARTKSRQKAREAIASGSPAPSKTNLRAALADAAILVIADGGPAADEILRLMGQAFPSMAGVPGKTLGLIKDGKLKPKLLKSGKPGKGN
jgi:hypothetical protein